MIEWKNFDSLESYGELAKAERVKLAEVMSGESGAERVKAYSVPMAAGMVYNYAAKQVDENVLAVLEKLAKEVIAEERRIYKGVSANIDFYSGFIYSMLDLPYELYTPLFAIARIAGWSAHRMEELVNGGRIIRPAYKGVAGHKTYTPIKER